MLAILGVPWDRAIYWVLLVIYNIFDLPNCLRAVAQGTFANDKNITLLAKTLTELKQASTELSSLHCWFKAIKLSSNVAKTEPMIIGSRQRLSIKNEDVEIRIDDQIIKKVGHTKALGACYHTCSTWCKYVQEISKTVSSTISALKRVRPLVSKENSIQIYNALILPHFD